MSSSQAFVTPDEALIENLKKIYEFFPRHLWGTSFDPLEVDFVTAGKNEIDKVTYYTRDGMNFLLAAGLKGLLEYTTPGEHTWTRPKGVNNIRLFMTGAGAGSYLYGTKNDGTVLNKIFPVVSPGGAGGNTILTQIKCTNRRDRSNNPLPDIDEIVFKVGEGGKGYNRLTVDEVNNLNDKDHSSNTRITKILTAGLDSIVALGGNYNKVQSENLLDIENKKMQYMASIPPYQDTTNLPYRVLNNGGYSMGYFTLNNINTLYPYFSYQKFIEFLKDNATIQSSSSSAPSLSNAYPELGWGYEKAIKKVILQPMYETDPNNTNFGSSESRINARAFPTTIFVNPYTNKYGQGGASKYGLGGGMGNVDQLTIEYFRFIPRNGKDGVVAGTGGGGVANPEWSIDYLFGRSQYKSQLDDLITSLKGGNGGNGRIDMMMYS